MARTLKEKAASCSNVTHGFLQEPSRLVINTSLLPSSHWMAVLSKALPRLTTNAVLSAASD